MTTDTIYVFSNTNDVKMTYTELEFIMYDLNLFYQFPKHVVDKLAKKWEKLDSGELDYCFVEWPADFHRTNKISIERRTM